MDTKKFKMGWMMVAFDLPVYSKDQRKMATNFRILLLDDGYQMISNKITQSILTNYKLHASNYAACKLMGLDFTQETFDAEEITQAETELNQRVQSLETGARSKLLEQYANPVIRQIQST